MASELIEIDTKEICLLCYNPCFKDDTSQTLTPKRSSSSSLVGFKQLLHYLNVNTKELFNCSPEFLQWMEMGHEIDVEISLCDNCSLVTEEFDKLYKQHELIQLQFDKCLTSLHQSMISGDESPDLVREFKTQMRPRKSMDLINASVAANLRSQTLKKCSLKLLEKLPPVPVLNLNIGNENQSENNIIHEQTNVHHNFEFEINANPDVLPGYQVASTSQLSELETTSNLETPVSVDIDHQITDFNEDTSLNIDEINYTTKSKKRKQSHSNFPNNPEPSHDQNVEKGRFSCEICFLKTFCTKRDLDRHRYVVHREHIIAKHFSSAVALSDVKQATDTVCNEICLKSLQPSGHQCSYCKQMIKGSKRTIFLFHVLRLHTSKIAAEVSKKLNEPGPSKSTDKCAHCSESFSSIAQFKMHQRTHQVVSCDLCPYISHSSDQTNFHKFDAHPVEIVHPHLPPETCPVKCGQALGAVLNQILKGKNCFRCGKVYNNGATLRHHLFTQHFDDVIKQLKIYLDPNRAESELHQMDEVEMYEEEMIIPVDVDFECDVKVEKEEMTESQLDPLD